MVKIIFEHSTVSNRGSGDNSQYKIDSHSALIWRGWGEVKWRVRFYFAIGSIQISVCSTGYFLLNLFLQVRSN